MIMLLILAHELLLASALRKKVSGSFDYFLAQNILLKQVAIDLGQ